MLCNFRKNMNMKKNDNAYTLWAIFEDLLAGKEGL